MKKLLQLVVLGALPFSMLANMALPITPFRPALSISAQFSFLEQWNRSGGGQQEWRVWCCFTSVLLIPLNCTAYFMQLVWSCLCFASFCLKSDVSFLHNFWIISSTTTEMLLSSLGSLSTKVLPSPYGDFTVRPDRCDTPSIVSNNCNFSVCSDSNPYPLLHCQNRLDYAVHVYFSFAISCSKLYNLKPGNTALKPSINSLYCTCTRASIAIKP